MALIASLSTVRVTLMFPVLVFAERALRLRALVSSFVMPSLSIPFAIDSFLRVKNCCEILFSKLLDSVLCVVVHLGCKRDLQYKHCMKGVSRMFQLNLKSRKSIYEQVIDNLKELIMTRALATDEKLPSVRELSKTITVNPNTVQKAYRELERQGYVYTTNGVGTFVADIGGVHPDAKALELAKAKFDDDFRQLLFLGLSFEDAKNMALGIIEERRPAND